MYFTLIVEQTAIEYVLTSSFGDSPKHCASIHILIYPTTAAQITQMSFGG